MECSKIEDVCVCQSHVIAFERIYVVDLKGATGEGGIEVYDSEPEYEVVFLENASEETIRFIAFDDNAFRIRRGTFAKQCECVLSPEAAIDGSWLLFIEMKYTQNEYNVQRDEWHKKAVDQIRSSVDFLKQKGVIEDDRKLNAIVSFPKLSSFSAWLTQYVSNELKKDNIIARCTNRATIVNDKILILA